MNYDVVIAHRLCPALAKSAVGYTDKADMIRASLESMREALMLSGAALSLFPFELFSGRFGGLT